MSKSRDLSVIGSFCGTLVGEIKMWPTTSAPDGYLLCDGSLVSRTTYAALFSAIGTTFGSGNGTTNFALPDYRDTMPIGAGNLYNLNGKGGSKDAIVVAHNHGVTDGGHSHSLSDSGHAHNTQGYVSQSQFQYSGGGGNAGVGYSVMSAGTTTSVGTGIGVNSGATGISINNTGSSANNANLPPYTGIHFIIRYT